MAKIHVSRSEEFGSHSEVCCEPTGGSYTANAMDQICLGGFFSESTGQDVHKDTIGNRVLE